MSFYFWNILVFDSTLNAANVIEMSKIYDENGNGWNKPLYKLFI